MENTANVRSWVRSLIICAFIMLVCITTTDSSGVCYRRTTHYRSRAYTVYHRTSSTRRYNCGFWPFTKRCSETRYGRGQSTKYTSDAYYSSYSYCCPGYYGHVPCKELPSITSQPVNVIEEKSNSASFHVRVRGYSPFTYWWYHNYTVIKNEKDKDLHIYKLNVNDSGSYYCRICNPDNRCVTSSTVRLTVTVNLPKVNLQPLSNTINLRVNNFNTSLSCGAKGDNLQYEWERSNGTIPSNTDGSNTSTLHFYVLSPENAGKYRCKVSNASGIGYSDYAILQIYVPAPQIIKQPVNTTAADPFGAHFSCTANGYGTIAITWSTENSKRGIPTKAIITEERSPESVTSMLFIPDVVLDDEGGYYCSAQIDLMNSLSQTAYLEEIMTPMIKVKMDNTISLLVRNYNLTMRCLPSDTDLKYKWNRKNTSLPLSAVGVNTSTMTIYRLTPEDAGDYQCVLSNISGVISSEFSTLKIYVPPPEITIPPQNISTTTYTNVTFSCTGRGFGEIKVIWTKPPSKVTATAVYSFNRYDDHVISTLTLNNVVGIYSGRYCCAIINHVGSSPIRCAQLTVTIPCPEISLFPMNNTIIVEEEAKFTCEAFSFSKVKYKWERQNDSLPDKAITDTCSSTLTIPNSTQFDEGNYCCIATNECGPVKECAILSVIDIPVIVLQPVGATVHVGTDEVEMNCSAVGHSRISYHWERHNFNNSEWSSLTKDRQTDINDVSIYTLTKITKNDEGMYRCVATNIDGNGYSNNATITVYGPPTIELSSTKVDGVEGHNTTLTCTATNDVDSPYDTHIDWFGPTGQVIENNQDDIYISVIKIDNVMTSALKFHPINHTQAGINKCKASNHPNSTNEMNVSIAVEYVPIVHITPSKSPYITAVGPDFLLHCSADGNPSPTVQWYKSGQPFTAMSLKSSQDVYVPRSSATDSALYECVATNYAGNKKEQRKNHIDFQVIEPTEGPCSVNNGECDHICTAEFNLVKCFCRVGYFSIAFLPTKCFDVDECQFNLDKCEDKCTNTPGSYECSCPYGQVLASNGYSCIKCANNGAIANFTQISPIMPTNIKESLWHVAICADNNSTLCSGSLINDNLIVTTANCVCNNNTILTESVSVKINKNYGCPTKEADAIKFDVSQIICHPLYNNATMQYNIALLRLATSVNTTAFAPVCLPVANTDSSIYTVNNFVGMYGYREFDKLSSSADGSGSVDYGNNSYNNNFDELYLQVAQIVPNADCGVAYNHSSITITNDMICTGSGENTDCWKYSGMPLVTQSQLHSHVILAAMGYHEEAKCKAAASHNNVHIKLDDYQEWIASQAYTTRP